MEKYNDLITPQASFVIKDNICESKSCFTHYFRELKFEVGHYDTTKVVDLVFHACSSKDWNFKRIPCK